LTWRMATAHRPSLRAALAVVVRFFKEKGQAAHA